MKGIAAQFGWFGAGLFCLVTVGWVLARPVGTQVLEGLPMDWTHRHVVFSQPVTARQARLLAEEPRFWQQEYRRSVVRVVSDEMTSAEEPNSLALAFKGIGPARVHRDWSQDLGNLASVGAGNYPAKYGFRLTTANCASPGPPDFVVFGTGLLGSTTQASIVAYDNLYTPGCSGTVPQVYWAYNTNGGQITTSPVFSRDGTQLAFVQNDGGIVATLVVLKWKSSTTETVSSPMTLAPSACTVAPCIATIPLTDGSGFATNDTTSSVFYDYNLDTAYVGDSASWLHKFHPFFGGTPTEIRTAPWPVQVNPGNPAPLSSPVHDQISNNIFVGDLGGFLESVNDGTGAVTISGQVDHGAGVVAGPVVDPTVGKVYVFASRDTVNGCAGAGCSAVYMFAANFMAGTLGAKAIVGNSSATPSSMYDGNFDSTYRSSANATGNLYLCGNTGTTPILYQVPIAAGVFGTVLQGPTLASGTTGCSPVDDVPNPNATGGASEWIFASVQNTGLGSGLTTSCASGGCLMNFKVTPWQPSTAYTVGQQVLDTHFQIQTVRIAGTSRTAVQGHPAWSVAYAGNTTDAGTLRWTNQGPLLAGYPTWVPSHPYALHNEIVDSNGDVEVVVTAGTSKAGAQPGWSLAVNGATNDGTVPTRITWHNVGSIATANLAASGGASGTIIDNTVGTGTMAGASQVYFSTQGNQVCGTSGTGGCAVQASQSALQ